MAKKSVELVQGDCLDGLRGLGDGVAKLVLTDPPYGIAYRDTAGTTVENDERPFIWWLGEAYRVTASPGALFCFCRWDVQEVFRAAIEAAGFDVRSQIVWAKRGGGQGNTRASAMPSHEVAWWATKGRFRFTGKRLDSVLTHRAPRERTHPTEKPVALLETVIRSATMPGDLVVDPFMGTGSCGVAARRTQRRFWGSELDPAYVETARLRLTGASSTDCG